MNSNNFFVGSKRAHWFQHYAIAKRAFMCGACSYPDAIGALEALGYGVEARHKEVIDWMRERAQSQQCALILAFEGEEEPAE